MGQEAASGDSFEMCCVIDKITDISSLDEGEEQAESETSLRHSNGYRREINSSDPADV